MRVQWLLELVNLIPPDVELADLSPLIQEIPTKDLVNGPSIEILRKVHLEVCRQSANLPPAFHRFLWSVMFQSEEEPEGLDPDPPDTIHIFKGDRSNDWFIQYFKEGPSKRSIEEYLNSSSNAELAMGMYQSALLIALAQYEFIRTSRINLRKIIELVYRKHSAYAHLGVHLLNVKSRMQVEGLIRIDDNGRLRIELDRFAAIVDRTDAIRIRDCEICKRIFWAGRLDATCCSRNCANALRSRRYRERRNKGLYQGARLTQKERALLGKASKPSG